MSFVRRRKDSYTSRGISLDVGKGSSSSKSKTTKSPEKKYRMFSKEWAANRKKLNTTKAERATSDIQDLRSNKITAKEFEDRQKNPSTDKGYYTKSAKEQKSIKETAKRNVEQSAAVHKQMISTPKKKVKKKSISMGTQLTKDYHKSSGGIFGHAVKVVKKTGGKVAKAVKDPINTTSKVVNKAVNDTSKTITKASKDTVNTTKKAIKDTSKMSDNIGKTLGKATGVKLDPLKDTRHIVKTSKDVATNVRKTVDNVGRDIGSATGIKLDPLKDARHANTVATTKVVKATNDTLGFVKNPLGTTVDATGKAYKDTKDTLHKATIDTGRAAEKAAQDTYHAPEQAVKSINTTVDKTTRKANNWLDKSLRDANDTLDKVIKSTGSVLNFLGIGGGSKSSSTVSTPKVTTSVGTGLGTVGEGTDNTYDEEQAKKKRLKVRRLGARSLQIPLVSSSPTTTSTTPSEGIHI